MINFDLQKIITWLGAVLTCPICTQQYAGGQTQVIHSEHNQALGQALIFIHSECGKCKGSIIFSVEIHGPSIRSVGIVTDLTSLDTLMFKNRQPLSADEIINIHQILENYQGNLLAEIASAK